MGPFLPTSLKIRKNTPYYAMVAILSNHGSSQKLVKMPQTLRVDRGAWIVHESSVEILIFRLVRPAQCLPFAYTIALMYPNQEVKKVVRNHSQLEKKKKKKKIPRPGIEPWTCHLQSRCSTSKLRFCVRKNGFKVLYCSSRLGRDKCKLCVH